MIDFERLAALVTGVISLCLCAFFCYHMFKVSDGISTYKARRQRSNSTTQAGRTRGYSHEFSERRHRDHSSAIWYSVRGAQLSMAWFLLCIITFLIFNGLIFVYSLNKKNDSDKMDDIYRRIEVRTFRGSLSILITLSYVFFISVLLERLSLTFHSSVTYRVNQNTMLILRLTLCLGAISAIIGCIFNSAQRDRSQIAVLLIGVSTLICFAIRGYVLYRFHNTSMLIARRMLLAGDSDMNSKDTMTNNNSSVEVSATPANDGSNSLSRSHSIDESNFINDGKEVTPAPVAATMMAVSSVLSISPHSTTVITGDTGTDDTLCASVTTLTMKSSASELGRGQSASTISRPARASSTASSMVPSVMKRSRSMLMIMRDRSDESARKRSEQLVNTSVRLTVVSAVGLLSTLFYALMFIVDVPIHESYLSLDITVNTFCSLCSFHSAQKFYFYVFGCLHAWILRFFYDMDQPSVYSK